MNSPFIYPAESNSKFIKGASAIIVMPDIFGITDYAITTMQEFAVVLQKPVYMFDYFYTLTNKPSKFSPEDPGEAVDLMQKMRGEDFVPAFRQVLGEIKVENPSIKEFTVIGFCFAGRLAYLTGLEKTVTKIVSFYGAGAHTPNYYQGNSPIEMLANTRQNDKNLSVISFYGTQDESIPSEDRVQTMQALQKAKINYLAKEYTAGHAYFQKGRPNYNDEAAKTSWQNLKNFLN